MKIVVVSFVGFLATTSVDAFVPTTTTLSKDATTHVRMVASTPGNMPKDSWSDKPLHRSESTTPVAERKVSKRERAAMSDVVIPPDYTLAYATALLGPLIMWYHPCESPSITTRRFRFNRDPQFPILL